MATTDDLFAPIPEPPWLPSVLRGVAEDRSLTSLQRRRLTSARFALLRESEVPRAGAGVKPVLIEVADELLPDGSRSPGALQLFLHAVPALREEILGATGVRVTGVRLRASDLLQDGEYRLLLNEVPYGGGTLPPGASHVPRRRTLPGPRADGRAAAASLDRRRGRLIDAKAAATAAEHGLTLLEPFDAVAWHLGGLIRVHLAESIGLSEAGYMLDEWESDGGPERAALVGSAMPSKSARIRLMMVLRALVRAQVPVDDMERILSALERSELGTPLADVVEQVRGALRRSLTGLARGRRTIELPDAFDQASRLARDRRRPACGSLRLKFATTSAPRRPVSSRSSSRAASSGRRSQRMAESLLPSAAVFTPAELGHARPRRVRRTAQVGSEGPA